jgi:hypothetical protein
VGPAGKDNQSGYGLIRPSHALSDNVPKSAPNPVFDAYDTWAAANGKGSNTGKPTSGSKGTDWGNVALVGSGMAVAPITLVVLLIVRRSNRRRRQFRPVGQPPGMPPSFGGPYPPGPQQTPPPPGYPPHLFPSDSWPQQRATPPRQGPAGSDTWNTPDRPM